MSESMSEARPSTPEEIEARLRDTRAQLAASVDALAERVSPQAQARAAGEQLGARLAQERDRLVDRVSEVRRRAVETVERAQEGDEAARRTVAVVAGGAVAAAAALGSLLRRGSRR
ncbi:MULTISPECIES: DUF3618 domain-containing protein [unclassified Actinomyces]|uniref:DUF3618 domain-containing protein n=1 Tax=unclassified Actinomyces TaxID=2609248 RepID=UPI0020171159|nr:MULTISPECIES: DUF3618 domain-containing protein [unclassified Actinomyces]MCL3777748.1 DUF3618 domain-containing protein [Actinomyces sp. AC-20-1]MCL3790908.1 DUF3618 domain-containing protein [Actinomyces sp. 187325]MCL3793166.1 DUF3618 domain-containing protein [Actinomyces sp. 186855]MCL3795321.1 DUF3618 domain-containing protein [Actinomyces sp. 217892]